MQKTLLGKWVLVLLLIFLSFSIVIYAKVLLLPLTLAGLLAMLFMPISRWFERKGIGRALASLLCVLIFIAILTAVIYFFIWQINAITQDVSAIQRNVMGKTTSAGNVSLPIVWHYTLKPGRNHKGQKLRRFEQHDKFIYGLSYFLCDQFYHHAGLYFYVACIQEDT